MVSKEDPTESQASVSPGRKKYGRLVRMFREGYLALHIYMNVYQRRTYYDIVIARKIKRGSKQEYVRGANLKPSDLPALAVLIKAADDYLNSVETENKPTG